MNPSCFGAQSLFQSRTPTPWEARTLFHDSHTAAHILPSSVKICGLYQVNPISALPVSEYEYREEDGGQLYSLYHVTVSPRFAHLSTEEVRLQAYTVPEPMQVDPPFWGLQNGWWGVGRQW